MDYCHLLMNNRIYHVKGIHNLLNSLQPTLENSLIRLINFDIELSFLSKLYSVNFIIYRIFWIFGSSILLILFLLCLYTDKWFYTQPVFAGLLYLQSISFCALWMRPSLFLHTPEGNINMIFDTGASLSHCNDHKS